MGILRNVVTPLHQTTSRSYIDRMLDDKVQCMIKAKEYGFDYWDGDRRYGYGGYRYIKGYWKPVAEILIEGYGLSNESKILDVGCGKAYLLYEIWKLLPGIEVAGFDISRHALSDSKREIKDSLFKHRAQDPFPFGDRYFDLVISLGCLHNLRIFDLEKAIAEIERVGNKKFIMVESYRTEQELFNLQCWALTCQSFFDMEEWIWLFRHFGYTGDFEFIFFE